MGLLKAKPSLRATLREGRLPRSMMAKISPENVSAAWPSRAWPASVAYPSYRDALDAAEQASAYPQELGFANFALVELVEAAARSGEDAHAADAAERLTRTTGPSQTPWGRASRRAPAQGDHQARHQLSARTPGRAARPHRAGPAGLTLGLLRQKADVAGSAQDAPFGQKILVSSQNVAAVPVP
jgi:hypothetical protein